MKLSELKEMCAKAGQAYMDKMFTDSLLPNSEGCYDAIRAIELPEEIERLSEQDILARMNVMCEESLNPDQFEQWVVVMNALTKVRRNLRPILVVTQVEGVTNSELLKAIGKYAYMMGEAWRMGEGSEIMDAYQSTQETIAAQPVPAQVAEPYESALSAAMSMGNSLGVKSTDALKILAAYQNAFAAIAAHVLANQPSAQDVRDAGFEEAATRIELWTLTESDEIFCMTAGQLIRALKSAPISKQEPLP